MNPSLEALAGALHARYPGTVMRSGYGETVLFYNPELLLTMGVYFASLKADDGPNDQASHLSREGVFRLAFGLSDATFARLFGTRPARPARGKVVGMACDFSALDRLTPHPVYAWMGWAQILSPTAASLGVIEPLLAESYARAQAGYRTRIGRERRSGG
jgi:hypothetical protein